MNVPHKRAREVAFWALYASDITGQPPETVLRLSRELFGEMDPQLGSFWDDVGLTVEHVWRDREAVDAEIQALSPRWKLSRMANIDRNILRIGVSELLRGEVLPIFVIDACVELGKCYGDASTPGFVNGLLDQFCRNHAITIVQDP